jgi:hypothetical protein
MKFAAPCPETDIKQLFKKQRKLALSESFVDSYFESKAFFLVGTSLSFPPLKKKSTLAKKNQLWRKKINFGEKKSTGFFFFFVNVTHIYCLKKN